MHLSSAQMVDNATTCGAGSHIPHDRRVLSAYVEETHDHKMLLTWSDTGSVSIRVTPRIFIEVALYVPVTDGCDASNCLFLRLTAISLVLRIGLRV